MGSRYWEVEDQPGNPEEDEIVLMFEDEDRQNFEDEDRQDEASVSNHGKYINN